MKRPVTLKPLTFYCLLFCACFSIFSIIGFVSKTPDMVSANVKEKDGKPKDTLLNTQNDYDNLKSFTEVIGLIKKNYYRDVEFSSLVQGAIKGMVATLDPHSAYLTTEDFNDLKVDTKGEFGGIGIEITIRDGSITVVSPIEDTPAYNVGIMSGDQILKIENELTKDMTLSEALKKMRGPKGTPVTIYVHREGRANLLPFTIVRDIIKVHSVRYRMLEDAVGYIRLSQFNADSSSEFVSALKALKKLNAGKEISGLVIDLRNNPGGLLTQAVRVSDIFLDGGMVVYTDGRFEDSKSEYFAHNNGNEPKYPIVILVNEGSASASEIVSGTFQDAKRAVIVGMQTFGKGSVQTVIPMEGEKALKLTTALYYTRSGRSIQTTGIVPDKIVAAKPIKLEEENTLDQEEQNFRIREESLKGAIKNPNGREENESNKELKISQYPKRKYKEPKYLIGSRDAMAADLGFVLEEDPQLAEGLTVIKQWISTGKIPEFLDKAKPAKVASK